jgi:hypothetical protein
VALCKLFGAESAGVGVCFWSKKMWFDMFSRAGFEVESLREDVKIKRSLVRKICLLIKSDSLDNVFVVKKKE